MTQEKDIILHSMIMDKVVDIVKENGLKLEVVKIRFPRPCHSKIIFPSSKEGFDSMIKTLSQINQVEMEYLKKESDRTDYLKGLERKFAMKRLLKK